MPKQGRRWIWWGRGPFRGLQGSPRPHNGEELMPTQEHVAALEGLAEDFEKRAAGEQSRANHAVLDVQVANSRGAAEAFEASAKVIRREVRNLIEQGGAK